MFDTDRLTIRAFHRSDMSDLMALANDLEVQNFVTLDHHIAPKSESFEDIIRGWVNTALFFGVITTKAGVFVGNIALIPKSEKNREALFTITLAKPFWSQGYGTEAMKFLIGYGFRSMALHRISLQVFASNPRAVKAYAKIGFVEEGRLRKARWHDGAWEDVILMAILEEDWAQLSK